MYLRHERAMSPRLSTQARIAVARRPWIRWSCIGGLAIVAAVSASGPLRAAEEARASWTDTATVFVARRDHAIGDALSIEPIELPRAAIPRAAITHEPRDASARQRITDGEIIVEVDVALGTGPGARADAGTVIIPIRDPLVTTASISAKVAIFADGFMLAESGEFVDVVGDVIFVAVVADLGPSVAAAAHASTASLAFLP